MAHCIRRREDVAHGLLRLIAEDLAAAEADLVASGDRDRRIHRVRRRLKRTRTLLRVLEPAFGDRAVAARRAIAQAGRLLARTRNADVAATSARALAEANADPRIGFDEVAADLVREAEIAHRTRTPVGDVALKLAAASALVAGFDPAFDGSALANAAIARAYAKGRKAMRRAEATRATGDFHDWRKAVKELWHLLRVLRRRLPRRAHRHARALDVLGEVLGRDHDHADLATKLALSPGAGPLADQLAVIAARRRALEGDAFRKGARAYKAKPRKIASRYAI